MDKTVDLNTLSIIELKAFVYDHNSLVVFHRNQVEMANSIIAKREQEESQGIKKEIEAPEDK
jgi:hypothetical protein